jgi:hypothetical protein
MMMPDVVIPPDYTLSWAVAALGPLIMWYHPSYMADGSPSLIGIFGGGFHILFATLLWVQTARVRCVFEKDGFEFYNVKGPRLDYENGKAELSRSQTTMLLAPETVGSMTVLSIMVFSLRKIFQSFATSRRQRLLNGNGTAGLPLLIAMDEASPTFSLASATSTNSKNKWKSVVSKESPFLR